MSGLTLPRIVFFGTTSWNPNTVNNSPGNYDEADVEPVLDGKTFAQYAQWLLQLNSSGRDLNGSWNIYGDHGVKFTNAAVTGVEPAAGAQDPLIGKPVKILGNNSAARMVDIDPYGPFTTQVFYQTFALGDGTVGVSGPGACRLFSRWPNFTRNLNEDHQLIIAGSMGVVWQAALPKASLTWNGTASSPALAALQQALEADPANQGLVFLFASYRTLYYQTASWNGQRITTPQELSDAYQAGFKQGNPAISATLGRVGVWGPGELASTPTGDLLLAPVSPVTTATVPLAKNVRPEGRLGLLAAAPQQQVLLGPAQARLDRSRNVITVDFLATFPESDASLAKADLGTFVLQVVDSSGHATAIGSPLTPDQYGRQAYESAGGIVEFSFADDPGLADGIAAGTLQLVQSGTVALQQVPLVSESDQRGLCLDEGTTGTIQVQSYQNGATPPSEPVQLLVVPYDENLEQITDPSQAVFELLDASGQPLPLSSVLPVGPDGGTTLTVSPLQPGIGYYFFFPFTGPVQPTPPDSFGSLAPNDYFVALRALPFDNALNENTPDSDLTWDFIYQNVLSTWDVVYPLMSTIIPLSNETAVNNAAAAIGQRLNDPFPSSQYMPVTRDMSAGKKTLLLRYLSLGG
ncbi:MAG TPA: hypothetical protein VHC97_11870 [Thermoanaerobaculia bacterium]|jgi:hypothetical protein|nr:hypothetical protein [Thermoanaerobaculia bacterium]